jgi:hypothetical protein
LLDLDRAELAWVALAVKEHIAFDPHAVSPFSSLAVVSKAQGLLHEVE